MEEKAFERWSSLTPAAMSRNLEVDEVVRGGEESEEEEKRVEGPGKGRVERGQARATSVRALTLASR
jgi:hypothetical protein